MHVTLYSEGELKKGDTMRKFGISELSTKPTNYDNLDVIISVGYRVKSQRSVQFRIWAFSILKELLERIRDIRASEKVFYRQVLEIYATSIDYDPKSEVSIQFFRKAQNKIHYAVSGETAAEIVYHRVDAEKDFLGLMSFSGEHPKLREAKVAKNYLDEKELRGMGQLVSGYLDFAQRQAEREIPMTIDDWSKHLDSILTSTGENILIGNGSVSHLQAVEKAQIEYKKYKAQTLSSVEKDYLASIKLLEQKSK